MPAHDPTAPYCYWAHPTAAIVTDTIDRSRRRGRPITRHEIMMTFDRLSAEVRQKLANADHPWAPSWCAEVRHLYGWTSAQIIERLAKADQERRDEYGFLLAGFTK
jgi:uncharacterized protein DUF6525